MSVSISQAVGFNAPNLSHDVEAIQRALTQTASLTLDHNLHPGPVDGVNGSGTEGAIEQFQRRLGVRKPDARIDPNGYTLRRLNALLAIGDVNITYPFTQRSAFAFYGAGAGMRAFGSRRSGGARAHAGIDLYFPDFTPVLAMADGTVVRFYLQTYAVEVDHGAFIARYGELAPEPTWPIRKGSTVQQGQLLGRIGILTKNDGSRLNVPSMMLHLELYDKTETGKLTRAEGTSAKNAAGVPFRRRRDLIDPTGFIHQAPLP